MPLHRRLRRSPALLTLALGMALSMPDGALRAQGSGPYLEAVAEHFGVSPDEVRILSGWGVQPDEIPVVLTIAAAAGVSTDAVLALRRSGRSWGDLATRYSFSAARLYVPLPEGRPLGALERIYGEYRSRPSTAWAGIDVQDTEMVGLVNLRFLAEFLGQPPAAVLDAWVRTGSGVAAFAALRSAPEPVP
jgi:hypothetical protein